MGDLFYKKCTLFITLLGFKRSQIKPKELAVLEMKQIFRMGVVTKEAKLTHGSILARIGFIKEGMVETFVLVMNTDAVLSKNLELQVGSRDRFRIGCREIDDFGRDCDGGQFIRDS